jgi:hypothetical protein
MGITSITLLLFLNGFSRRFDIIPMIIVFLAMLDRFREKATVEITLVE